MAINSSELIHEELVRFSSSRKCVLVQYHLEFVFYNFFNLSVRYPPFSISDHFCIQNAQYFHSPSNVKLSYIQSVQYMEINLFYRSMFHIMDRCLWVLKNFILCGKDVAARQRKQLQYQQARVRLRDLESRPGGLMCVR